MDKNENQPFYKKWWFWLVIVVVIIGGTIGVTLNNKKKSENNQKSAQSSKIVKKPQPVTDKTEATKIAQTVIYEYLTKEKKQKINKKDIEISTIKTSGPYYVKKDSKARMHGWEAQGKINNKSKGSSVNLVSAVIDMPDQDKNELDYLAIGWDTFVNEVNQNSPTK